MWKLDGTADYGQWHLKNGATYVELATAQYLATIESGIDTVIANISSHLKRQVLTDIKQCTGLVDIQWTNPSSCFSTNVWSTPSSLLRAELTSNTPSPVHHQIQQNSHNY